MSGRGRVNPARQDRVDIRYKRSEDGRSVELPFRVLVISDFRGVPNDALLEDRRPVEVTDASYGEVMAEFGARLRFEVEADGDRAGFEVDYAVRSLGDFGPEAITAEVGAIALTRKAYDGLCALREAPKGQRDPEAFSTAERAAVEEALTRLGEHVSLQGPLWAERLDQEILATAETLSGMIDATLHHERFQSLERAWRSVDHLLRNSDGREGVRVSLFCASKQELLEDFEDASEITRSGLYRWLYSAEFGTFGGEPFSCVCVDASFGPGPQDIHLLRQLAAVGAMAHAPILANAGPEFVGREDFRGLATFTALTAEFEGAQYARWRSLREADDARYLTLCLPRFLLRAPHRSERRALRNLGYNESAPRDQDRLWGHASFLLAQRAAASFARYRWALHISGASAGGRVSGLLEPTLPTLPRVDRLPVEVQLGELLEAELAQNGFASLVYLPAHQDAAFFSVPTARSVEGVGDDLDSIGRRLEGLMPYTFLASRVAHNLKVVQREQLGRTEGPEEIQRELNAWLRQYVSTMDNPAPAVRARRPLRDAEVQVEEVEGNTRWLRCHLKLQPHLLYLGASFSLSVVTRLDRSVGEA